MVIRMRHTRSHTKNRRTHHKLIKPTLSKDKGGVLHVRHRASLVTGQYRGRQVVDVEAQIAKKEQKRKKKMARIGKEEGAKE